MNERLTPSTIDDLLRVSGEYLYHREGQELEFKEQFNRSGLAEYFKDFAAFANNRGGYLIFGIKDSPRARIGLTEKSLEQFEGIDAERITGFLLEIFSCAIHWEQSTHTVENMKFGCFYIHECRSKPIIAKIDHGKDNSIRNGEIYYRYGGRTQKIQFGELQSIINKRIENNNQQWLNLVERIKTSGPENVAVYDMQQGTIENGNNQVLLVDEALVKQMNFIKEGEFNEVKGAKTLKLIGEVKPIDTVEVIKKVKENLVKEYPLSAKEMVSEVKKKFAGVMEHEVWDILKANKIRGDSVYSAYNFRSKKHEDIYTTSGVLSKGTPCIFNNNCVEFILKILKTKRG